MKEKKQQNKTKTKKEIKLAEELSCFFSLVPFRSREFYFPRNVCKINQLELVVFNSHKRDN